jgi:hypothetical protein
MQSNEHFSISVFNGYVSRRIAGIKTWSRLHRRTILPLAACAFLVGAGASVNELGLTLNDLDLWPILLIWAVGVPASVVLNAIELQLCARAIGRRLTLRQAVAITTTATVSNLLPMPAGFAIRGGALVAAGANLRETGIILLAAGLMWLAMALAVTGVALTTTAPIGMAVAMAGITGAIALALWIRHRSGAVIALGFVAVRAFLLAILAVRLWLSFAAIGAAVPFVETAYYAVAGIAGTVVMVVPAGLGVSEVLAAAMAEAVGSSPSLAFLALSLNRVLGLLLSGAIAGWLWAKPFKSF